MTEEDKIEEVLDKLDGVRNFYSTAAQVEEDIRRVTSWVDGKDVWHCTISRRGYGMWFGEGSDYRIQIDYYTATFSDYTVLGTITKKHRLLECHSRLTQRRLKKS